LNEAGAKDRATSVEQFGVEHIPESQRHGSPRRIFTLWFAANLTIADYVVGVLCTSPYPNGFGLTVSQSFPILLIGNLLGGLLLGFSGAMGPKLGFPQMFSSRSVFGRKGNYALGGFNWVSTIGWFAVNTILGTEAIRVLAPSANFYAVALILVAIQVLIAIYGHDFIHLFEKWMSIVLGILWAGVLLLSLLHIGKALTYVPAGGPWYGSMLGALGLALSSSFSYIMSWSPYSSDYSRYLPTGSSQARITVLALAGGATASFGVEVIGSLVGSLTGGNSSYFSALYSFAGEFGIFAIAAVVLGAIAANALNIYTNSLSALVLDVKTKRWVTVVVGGIVGLAIAYLAGANFESFFENFLLTLDYWITPWLAIILVDFFVIKRTSTSSILRARDFDFPALGIYAVSILISVPFMDPPYVIASPYNHLVGALNGWFGGADFSYFISFGIAAVLYLFYRKMSKSGSSVNAPQL
jgi:nucleobase:cation symporter-1, NCS1 family